MTSSCCSRNDGIRSMIRSLPPAAEGFSSAPSSEPGRTFVRPLLACFVLGVLVVLGGLAWAALAHIELERRDELFEIPKGTYARRVAGDKVDILPQSISLTLGANDVLLLRNLDDVPQLFGPALIMPGQSFRLPFAVASTYSFECTAHPSGQMTVVVHPKPEPGWRALQWRFAMLMKRLRLSQSPNGQTRPAALGSSGP